MNQDLLYILTLGIIYIPCLLSLHRLYYRLFPKQKNRPAQGPAAKLVFITTLLFILTAIFAKISLPALSILFIFIGSQGLSYFAILCVSESGRRYYMLQLIEQGKLKKSDLRKYYSKDYMIDIRLQRLESWKAINKTATGKYLPQKASAYYYSLLYYYWGRILGFKWF